MNKSLQGYADAYIHYGIILFVCFFSFFIHNHVIPADLMEARNLATAQEMVRYGNYLLPTMNGELRLEKPPLPTWIAAGIEHVIPDSLVAQRCASGIMAFFLVLFLYLLVSRLTRNRDVGLIASLILATSINVILMGRTATWDIYTHSFMLGAIWFLIIALEEKGPQWKNFILSGLFMGLSFLSKGPVSVYALLLPFLISYIIVYRPRMKGKVFPLAGMILICLVVSFWWVAYTFVLHEDMLIRVAGKESSAWLNYNVRPWYYYWQFPAEAGIWALFWVTSLVHFFSGKNRMAKYRKEYTFSVIWLFASLILLSVIPEKKTRYLLPLLVPGAMTIGFYMYRMITGKKSKRDVVLFSINAILIALVLMALPVALYVMFYPEKQISLFLLTIITLSTWGLAVFILLSLFGKKKMQAARIFQAIILAMIVVASFCLVPIGKVFINADRHSIKLLREDNRIRNLPFYHNSEEFLRMELVYEANQRILPLDISDDETIGRAVPFVFVSGLPIDSLMAGKHVTIEKLGTFDNNWRKPDHKRYNPDLTKEVAVIRKK